MGICGLVAAHPMRKSRLPNASTTKLSFFSMAKSSFLSKDEDRKNFKPEVLAKVT
jgi:hypothetical protein